jgi:tRNA-splicing ligase RtcB (3'-phosphate/5'-hydroxy nucleic acid ligase)
MKMTVFDRRGGVCGKGRWRAGELANTVAGEKDRLANILESETRFGVGASFKQRREHDVMDEDWSVSPVTQRLRDKASAQLGTSSPSAT